MKVKELIVKLLDMRMDADVTLYYPKVHDSKHGICHGYAFHIDSVQDEGNMVDLVFNDWRDKEQNNDK